MSSYIAGPLSVQSVRAGELAVVGGEDHRREVVQTESAQGTEDAAELGRQCG